MSIAASVPVSLELQLRVPSEYARAKARKMVLWLLLYVLAIEMLFISYDLHAGHERFTHDGFIVLFCSLFSSPWISLSSSNWVFAFNDKGISLRDTSNVLNSTGFNLIRWNQYRLLSFDLGEWRGYPAIDMKFLHKNRECTKLFVFHPEEESIVRGKLIPWLNAKLPVATSDAMLTG